MQMDFLKQIERSTQGYMVNVSSGVVQHWLSITDSTLLTASIVDEYQYVERHFPSVSL